MRCWKVSAFNHFQTGRALRHTRLKLEADMWLSCSKCHITVSAEESESKWHFGVWRRDCCCEILCIQNGRYPVSYFILNKEINLETGLFYVVDRSRKRGDLNSMVIVSTNSFCFWTWPCLLEMHKLQNCASVNCELNPMRSSSRSWNTFVRATC